MSAAHTVLIVHEDAATREKLASLLEEGGMAPVQVKSAASALGLLGERDFDAVISDLRLPDMPAPELIGRVRELRPETPVVLTTPLGSVDSQVEALRAGAFDHITEPFQRDEVAAALERALEHRVLSQENRRLRRAVERAASLGDVIGASPAMREIVALVRRVAASRSHVLITGESGTGTGTLARALHYCGSRRERPFVPVHCAVKSEELLEGELFGRAQAPSGGAPTVDQGLLVEAHTGTLYLDEIGELPLRLQDKLSRVLQDREVRPVGGSRSVQVDVRVIASAHRNLQADIERQRFSKDLYYRLAQIPIHIPPLRERPEDIPVLARAFLSRHARGEPRELSPAALDRLMRARWEGNARELEDVIERALARGDAPVLGPGDLPLEGEAAVVTGGGRLERALIEEAYARRLTLRELGDLYVQSVLDALGGNKVQAARVLGINRRTLYRWGESGHLNLESTGRERD